jgi:glucan phosphoethanolaminetransferase (alkaline phosphatase superfamily)
MGLQIFALSLPKGSEWILVVAILFFVFFWIKIIIEIVKSEMTNPSKIMWLLFVVFTGIFGMVMYKIREMFNYANKKEL